MDQNHVALSHLNFQWYIKKKQKVIYKEKKDIEQHHVYEYRYM